MTSGIVTLPSNWSLPQQTRVKDERRETCFVTSSWFQFAPDFRCISALLSSLIIMFSINVTDVCRLLEPVGIKPCAAYAGEKLSLVEKTTYFSLVGIWGKFQIGANAFSRAYQPRQQCRLGWRWANVGTRVPTLDQRWASLHCCLGKHIALKITRVYVHCLGQVKWGFGTRFTYK